MAFPSFLKKTKAQKLADKKRILEQASGAVKDFYKKLYDAGFDDIKHLVNYYTSISKTGNGSWGRLRDSEKRNRLLSLIDKTDKIDKQDLLRALKEQHIQKMKENLPKANNPKPFTDQDFYIKNKYSPEELDYYVTKELELDPKSVLHPTEQFVSDDKIQKVIDEYIDREWKRELDALDQKEKFEASINYPVKLNFHIPNKIQKFDVRKRQKSKTLEAMLDRVLAEGELIRGTSEDFDADIPINMVTTKRKGRWDRGHFMELTKEEKDAVLNALPEARRYNKIPYRTPEFNDLVKSRKKFVKVRDEASGREYYPAGFDEEVIEQGMDAAKIPHTYYKKQLSQTSRDAIHDAEIQKYYSEMYKKSKSAKDIPYQRLMRILDNE